MGEARHELHPGSVLLPLQLSFCLFVCMSFKLSESLSVCLSVSVLVFLSGSVGLSIYLSIYLPLHPSISFIKQEARFLPPCTCIPRLVFKGTLKDPDKKKKKKKKKKKLIKTHYETDMYYSFHIYRLVLTSPSGSQADRRYGEYLRPGQRRYTDSMACECSVFPVLVVWPSWCP